MTKEGTVLDGKYEILAEVGRGGMSIVYLARDKRLNKQWAVKEIKNDGKKSAKTLLKGLEREANILKNVDHPVLPRIVDIINQDGTIYVVMDYIEGDTIQDRLKKEGAQPQESALPGYYLFNKKYKYLHGIYSMKFDIFNVTVIIVFFICLATILIKLLKNNKFKSENIKKKFIIFFIAIAYTIIPTIPNAITPLYQENVSENYFTSIPVSFFIYFAMIFIITFGVWLLSAKANKLIAVPICCICILGTSIYITNKGIAEQQFLDYQRFVSIENFLSLEFWNSYQQLQIKAPSFYETQNNLAIENGHWTNYMTLYNKGNIEIDSDNDNAECKIQIQEDNSFYMKLYDMDYYVTKKNIEDKLLVKDLSGVSQVAYRDRILWEGQGYTIYEITIK